MRGNNPVACDVKVSCWDHAVFGTLEVRASFNVALGAGCEPCCLEGSIRSVDQSVWDDEGYVVGLEIVSDH